MAHVQQQALDRLQAAIAAGDTRARKVFVDRIDPVRSERDDFVLIVEDESGEESQPDQTIKALDRRTLTVRVGCLLAAPGEDAAAQSREFGLEVEKAVKGTTDEAKALRALCGGGVRLIASKLVNNGEGKDRQALREQTWQLTYFVKPAAPDVAT